MNKQERKKQEKKLRGILRKNIYKICDLKEEDSQERKLKLLEKNCFRKVMGRFWKNKNVFWNK